MSQIPLKGIQTMSPELARKFISRNRLTYDQAQKQLTFFEIKQMLIEDQGCSYRQAEWAVELYTTNLEEIVLTCRIDDIKHATNYPNYSDIMQIKNYERIFANLCAHDCIKIWFDKNVRIFLQIGLQAKELEEKQINIVLFEICDFAMKQFQEDKIPDVSTHLPLWLPANTDYSEGWEKGIKEEHQRIIKTYREPIEQYLVNYLSEKQIQEICDTAFDLDNGDLD